MGRSRAAVVAFALAGLVLVAGVTYLASRLVSQPIGLAAEPATLGRSLAPVSVTTTTAPTTTSGTTPQTTTRTVTTTVPATVPPTTTSTTTPDSDDHGGKGRDHDADDD